MIEDRREIQNDPGDAPASRHPGWAGGMFMRGELHEDLQDMIDLRDRMGLPPVGALSVEAARRMFEDLYAPPADPLSVGMVRQYGIPGPGGAFDVRIYTPEGQPPFPILMFFHGGGFVIGSLDTHDTLCRVLCRRARCSVVSVDYRLAPEHPFPAALEDCRAATHWVAEHPGVVLGDLDRLAVGGDSAGGNLAAALALSCRDRAGPGLCHQLLIYPAVNNHHVHRDLDSYEENAEGFMLSIDDLMWFSEKYLPDDTDLFNPLASPLEARDLSGLPPATVVTAGFDPLRDEGVAYARRLEEEGVPVDHRNFDDVTHGFAMMLDEPRLDRAHECLDYACERLRECFGNAT